MRPFLRAIPALLATLSLTIQPLAAEQRYYFRNIAPTYQSAPVAPIDGNPSVSVGASFFYDNGQQVSIVPSVSNFPSAPAWSVTPGLPNGLGLNASTGAITGSSTVAGSTSHTLTAIAGDKTATASFSLTIAAAPAILVSSNNAYSNGQSVSIIPTASNFPASPTWAIAPNLPTGLSLDAATGAITGSSTATGTTNHTLTATAGGKSKSASLSITINAPAANPPQFSSYATSYTFVAGEPIAIPSPGVTGGIGSLAFSLSPSESPFAIVPSTGEISWPTPYAGTWAGLVVAAKDSTNAVGSSNAFTIVVNPALSAGSYGSAKEMMIGDQRSFALSGAGGGRGALAFDLAAGSLPGGLQLQSNGAVSGIASAAGSFSGTVRATDGDGRQATTAFSASVYGTFALVDPQVPSETIVGSTYAPVALMGTGGKQPHTFALSGSVPPGYAVSGQSLTIQPTQAGSFGFTLTGKDAYSPQNSDSRLLASTVYATPALTAAVSPNAILNEPIDAVTAQASGGKAPYSWSTTGSLPVGLTFANGVLSGTPTQAGSYTFSLVATESLEQRQATAGPFTVVVDVPAQVALADSNPPASELALNAPVSTTFAPTGGFGNVTLTASGDVPPGLTLNGNVLSGTVTTAGTYTFTVTAKDSYSPPQTRSKTYTVAVYATVSGSLSAGIPASATYQQPIQQVTLNPVGGKAPYTFAFTGTLPPGLTFANGVLSGTPNTVGSYTYALTVADSFKPGVAFSTGNYTTVIDYPVLAVGPQNMPGSVEVGQTTSFFIKATGGVGPYTYALSNGGFPTGLTLNGATGEVSGKVDGSNPPQTAYNFRVTATDSRNPAQSATTDLLGVLVTDSVGKQVATYTAINASTNLPKSFPAPTVSGGKSPYSFQTSDPNVTLNADGSGSVIYAAQGDYTPTVVVKDADNRSVNVNLPVAVRVGPTISTTSLPNATQGQTGYQVTLQATGGTAPYTWEIKVDGTTLANYGVLGNTGIAWNPVNKLLTGNVAANAQPVSGITLQATDSNGRQSAVVGPMTLGIAIQTLAISSNYSIPTSVNVQSGFAPTKFIASGGTAPYSFQIASGSLPPGITLNTSTGELLGNASYSGNGNTYTFSVKVNDSQVPNSTETSAVYSVTVLDANPLNVTYLTSYEGTSSTPGTIPAPTVSGGTGSISFTTSTSGVTVTNGSTGTANFNFASANTYPVTITASDTIGRSKASTFNIVIKGPPSVSTASLPQATQNQANYSATLAATGGTAPYPTWQMKLNGAVVANNAAIGNTGLVWKTDGTITGNVSASASSQSNLTFAATDSFGRTSAFSGAYILTVNPRPTAPAYTTPYYATATIAGSFNLATTPTGGTAPYTYNWVTAPSDTSNVTINSTTGAINVAAGLATGTYTYTVAAKDVNGVVGVTSTAATIVSASRPVVTTSTIADGTQNSTYSQTLAWTGGSGTLGAFTLTNNGTTVTSGGTIGNTGLVWSATSGTITGTVAQAASSQPNLSVTVRDVQGRTSAPVALSLTIAVAPTKPVYAGVNPTTGTALAVNPTTASTGGAGGVTHEIVSVSPTNAGITMTNPTTGQITVNSAVAGTFTVTVRGRDSANNTSQNATFVANVADGLNYSLQNGTANVTVGQAYSNKLIPNGGNGTYSYSIVTSAGTVSSGANGTMPKLQVPWLATGVFSGTIPTNAKSLVNAVANVYDTAGRSFSSAPFSILVNVTPAVYANASMNEKSSLLLSPTTSGFGGSGTLTYSIASSPTDAGITVDATGKVGVSSAVAAGTYTVTVTTIDGGTPSMPSGSTSFTLTVNPISATDPLRFLSGGTIITTANGTNVMSVNGNSATLGSATLVEMARSMQTSYGFNNVFVEPSNGFIYSYSQPVTVNSLDIWVQGVGASQSGTVKLYSGTSGSGPWTEISSGTFNGATSQTYPNTVANGYNIRVTGSVAGITTQYTRVVVTSISGTNSSGWNRVYLGAGGAR